MSRPAFSRARVLIEATPTRHPGKTSHEIVLIYVVCLMQMTMSLEKSGQSIHLFRKQERAREREVEIESQPYLRWAQVIEHLMLHFLHDIQRGGHIVNSIAKCVLDVAAYCWVQLKQLQPKKVHQNRMSTLVEGRLSEGREETVTQTSNPILL